MGFHFRLETLLALRRSRERQEELKLQTIGQRLSLARKRLYENEESRRNLCLEQLRRVRDGISGAELHFIRVYEESLANAGLALLHAISDIEKEFASQQKTLASERLRRETLETLKQREYDRYRIEEIRREQSMADELFLTRHASAVR